MVVPTKRDMQRSTQGLNAKEVGGRIALGRKELGGMTQRELADLVGVTERSVAGWEIGEVIPFRHVRRLEEVLAKPAAWILYGEEGVPVDLGQQLDAIRAQLDWIRSRLEVVNSH